MERAGSAALYEAWVGAVLSRAGLYTMHMPFVIRGVEAPGPKDLLEPDLVVSAKPDAMRLDCTFSDRFEVEIKSLSLTFFNTDSYPFDDVLICSQNSFLRKWPGRDYICRDFLLVSKPTGAIIWVPAMTQVELGKEVTDKTRGETYKAVCCSRDKLRPLADFVEMVKDT